MLRLLIVLVLAVSSMPLVGQENQAKPDQPKRESKNKQGEPQKEAPAVNPQRGEPLGAEARNTHEHTASEEHRPYLTRGEWVMGVLTLVYVAISFFALLAIRRQVIIAKEAAEAASQNAKALMNAERAWVLVQLNLALAPAVGQKPALTYSFTNYGRTPAFVTRLCVGFIRLPSADKLPSNPEDAPSKEEFPIQEGGLPVPPGQSGGERTKILEGERLTTGDMAAITEGATLLYGFVFLRYMDVYGREFTSSTGVSIRVPKERFDRWSFLHIGPSAYNKVT